MKQVVRYINNWLKAIVLEIQEFALFIVRAIRSLCQKPRYWNDLFDHMDIMGVGSIPIVFIGGCCVGAILATETLFQLRAYSAEFLLGRITGVSVIRGAGPVLHGDDCFQSHLSGNRRGTGLDASESAG